MFVNKLISVTQDVSGEFYDGLKLGRYKDGWLRRTEIDPMASSSYRI